MATSWDTTDAPSKGKQSFLPSRCSLPRPSTQQVLLEGRAPTALQQERTVAEGRKSKGFFPPEQRYRRCDASWANNLVGKSKTELSLDPQDSRPAPAIPHPYEPGAEVQLQRMLGSHPGAAQPSELSPCSSAVAQ